MRLLRATIKRLLRTGLNASSLLLGPLFSLVARTGYGVDICWRYGFLPLPAHYYYPVPDMSRLRGLDWDKKTDLKGVSFDEPAQISLLHRLSKYHKECTWPHNQLDGQYYASNPYFGYSSACLLYTMIRTFKPSRVIEVGGGFSTHIICQALRENMGESRKGSLVTIEPYPGNVLLSAQAKYGVDIFKGRVEDSPAAEFGQLKAGDVLFIDSSHVVRIGGDVNFLLLEVIPRLSPGVIVHVHDIYLPYEYPISNYFGSGRKHIWTEQYLLQAFLSFNSSFKTLLAVYWLQREHSKDFLAAFPDYDSQRHRPSSSFYFQRTL